jgi:Zinc carboxypeptidase
MRKLLFILLFPALQAGAQELSYYLPTDVRYNPAIPTPEQVVGHHVGEWHVTHDRLLQYMRAIDQASDRITLTETGQTYEGRKQVVLTVTSPSNHARIEQIRQEHLQLSDPDKSGAVKTADMPAVVWIGCSIHGNEPSGANASLLAAYYLAAAEGPRIDSLLSSVVVLLDPSFNPDGLQRFSTWVNYHKSMTQVSDPNAREFSEVWPGGRFNHYWFDINRDWLPAQHPESRNRLVVFHQWKPNILTDHHEMGTNATFFFQPGVPSRVNANTPKRNQELTNEIAKVHARYLDRIGSFYFTKEGYDDYYYGKGSTYPDVNGSIGILFEQASSRGHAQESANGLLTFPFTIRNQFTTMLSTMEAARQMRTTLLDYQREFYLNARKEAAAFPVKAYVFGDSADATRNQMFLQMLSRHQVDIYALKTPVQAGGRTFRPGSAWVIPTNQVQFKLIKSMFEKTLKFEDSLFYDISAWTLPLATGVSYAELNSWNPSMGDAMYFTPPATAQGQQSSGAPPSISVTRSSYAYILDWKDYSAPGVLYRLQQRGLLTKVTTNSFEAITEKGKRKFSYGDILIPVQNQGKTADEVYAIVQAAVAGTNAKVYAIEGGFSETGVDLGSASITPVRRPNIMIFAGNGSSPTDVGELWHLLDTRYRIPASLVDIEQFNRIEPSKYSVILMPSGTYTTLTKEGQDKLRNWVSAGGTLVAMEDAVQYAAQLGLTKVLIRKDPFVEDSTISRPYVSRTEDRRALDMPGSIFSAKMDLSHPIAYGYTDPDISLFKSNTIFMDRNNSAYNTPVQFTASPLTAGYLHKRYLPLAPNAAAVNIDALGRGRIISMTENPNFRAFWFGTNRLLMNAIFFGVIMEAR